MILYAIFLLLLTNSPREKVKKRISALAENADLEYVHEAVLSEKKKRKKENLRRSKLFSHRFEDYLASSGVSFSAGEYITMWIGFSVGPCIFGSLLKLGVLPILALSIVGFAIPPVIVRRSKQKRQQLFNKQLGEALSIMSNCMKSGYSFQQAMNSIAREMQQPISGEFGRVVREINYGTSLEQALNNLVSRVDNKDLELLVSAVLTSTQVGANLSEILDTIGETVNDRIAIREEVRVASSQGRFSGILIGLLPVVVILFLMLLSPDYFTGFVDHPVGRILLIVSGIMEGIGFLVISRIVDIQY